MHEKQPKKTTVLRRKQTVQSKINTTKVRQAIFRHAVKSGLDELSPTEVAKLSGLTTGAIYGRFEDRNEMAIELWQSVISQPFKARLQQHVEFMNLRQSDIRPNEISNQNPVDNWPKVGKDLESPDAIAKLGAEFLVVARRNIVIGEVVVPEVTSWFKEFGLTDENDAIGKAAIAIALSASIGTALRAFVTTTNPNWPTIANALRQAASDATPTFLPAETPMPNWVNVETPNPIRTALITAVSEVVAKSGFANATVSRIVRRAGITNGSLYNLYADKEALIDDAMEIFLNLSSDLNHDGNRRATLEARADRGLADSFTLGLMANRRMWLDFRLETLIAARNHLPTRKSIKHSYELSRDNLESALPDLSTDTIGLLSSAEQAIGIGFITLDRFTALLHDCDFYSIMSKLAEQNQLLRPEK